MDNITIIAQMLSEAIQQALSSDYTLTDIEKTTRCLAQEVGRQAMAMVVNAAEAPYPAPEMICSRCEAMMPYVRRRPVQLKTLFGNIAVRRAYYLCPKCHHGCYPLDQPPGVEAERH